MKVHWVAGGARATCAAPLARWFPDDFPRDVSVLTRGAVEHCNDCERCLTETKVESEGTSRERLQGYSSNRGKRGQVLCVVNCSNVDDRILVPLARRALLRLDARGTELSAAGLARLAAARPGVEIVADAWPPAGGVAVG